MELIQATTEITLITGDLVRTALYAWTASAVLAAGLMAAIAWW